MKKFIIAMLLVISIVGIISFYNNNDNVKLIKHTSMEFFQYDNIKQLKDSASDIIKGKIIKKETRIINTTIPNEFQDSELKTEGEADTTGESYDNVPASILNPTQSSYIYTNEASKSTFKALESVNSENDLSLTYDDLNGFLNDGVRR